MIFLPSKIKYFYIAVFFCIFFISPKSGEAASFQMSPSSGSVSSSGTITLTVSLATSSSVPVNAFSGRLNFPAELVSNTSVSVSSSIANFWTVQPTVSSDGVIRFEGIVLNPGFNGSGGKLFTATFKAEGSGTANFNLTSASILANDGLGTNVLSSTLPVSVFTIGNASPVSTTPATTTSTPIAPEITSSSHSNPNGWYKETTADLYWELPKDANGVSFVLDKNPGTIPPKVSKGLVSSYKSDPLGDGVWYMHVMVKNSIGWGSVAHYRIGVDTVAPSSVNIVHVHEEIPFGTSKFNLSAEDATSGIAYYEVSFDAGDPEIFKKSSETDLFESKILPPKRYLVVAIAYDFAGNSTPSIMYFTALPVNQPVVTEYSQNLSSGDYLSMSGTGYPDENVKIHFEKSKTSFFYKIFAHTRSAALNEEVTKVDKNGNFSFKNDESWNAGIYYVTVRSELSNGAVSEYTDPIQVTVESGAFIRFIESSLRFLIPVIPFLLAVIFILFAGLFILKYFKKYRRVLSKQVREAEGVADESMRLIDGEVLDEINLLKKVRSGEPLSEREQAFLTKLRSDLGVANSHNSKRNKRYREEDIIQI